VPWRFVYRIAYAGGDPIDFVDPTGLFFGSSPIHSGYQFAQDMGNAELNIMVGAANTMTFGGVEKLGVTSCGTGGTLGSWAGGAALGLLAGEAVAGVALGEVATRALQGLVSGTVASIATSSAAGEELSASHLAVALGLGVAPIGTHWVSKFWRPTDLWRAIPVFGGTAPATVADAGLGVAGGGRKC
jgi:hypothetical protein